MPKSPPELLGLSRLPSPVGEILLVTDDAGAVRALEFSDYEPRMRRLITRHWGAGARLRDKRAPRIVSEAVQAYFAGEAGALEALEVRTAGTAFQQSVWAALRAIPQGKTWSYSQLAATIGAPRAVRAAGLANSQNPVALVVPCHRVIGASGALTGYAGGLERKLWLLRHERALPPSLHFPPAPLD